MSASRYEVFGATDAGCVRANNEDAYLIDEPAGLFLLADGMGGAKAGEHASQLAVQTAKEHVRSGGPGCTDLLQASFLAANDAVRTAAAADFSRHGMGTTLVGALDCPTGELAIANVGDSRCYLFHNGELAQITEDQTWAQEIGRHLGIDATAMRSHPMRHVLTMAIGAEVELRVQTFRISPQAGELVLLCSDGLHGVIGTNKIQEVLNSGQSLEAQAHYLIDEARKAGGPDNITVVLLRKKPENERV